MKPNPTVLRHLGAACLAALALAACQPAALGPLAPAQVAESALFLDAADGGTATLTITPSVAAGRQLLAAAPPYAVSAIATTDVSLYRVGSAEAGLRQAGQITGDPSGKTVTVGNLRPGASYRLTFVSKDSGGTVVTAANQGVDFSLDANGVATLAGPVTIQLQGAVRPGIAVSMPGFEVVEGGTPVKGFVTAYGDNLTATPGGIAFGPDGALYVASAAGIEKLKADGTLDTGFSVTGLSSPSDVAVVGASLYIADAGNNRVVTAPLAGGAATAFGVTVAAPAAIAVGPDGHVYVSTGRRVARLNANGELATFLSAETIAYPDVFNQLISGDSPEIREFNAGKIATAAATVLPGGLTFDPRGNLFVVDRGRKGIWKVTPAGTATRTQATVTGGAIDIVYGSDGRYYLTGADKKVYTFDGGDGAVLLAGGAAAGTVGAYGTGAGFAGLAGIAQDADGFVYVAETGASPRIRKVL